jgi:hypothetical protein
MLLEECRMVLPGIQALFGFQLVAVINQAFDSRVPPPLQRLHLVATTLTCIAIALVMTPAALHRQVSPRSVSDAFLILSTRLLVWSMFPLAASICLELYLVGFLIVRSPWVALLVAGVAAMFASLWVVLPRLQRRR